MLHFSIKRLLDFNKDPLIALDISSNAIKLMYISHINDAWRIEAFGQASLPKGVSEGVSIKNPESFANILKALFLSLGIKTKRVMLTIPDSMVISKTIQVNEGLNDMEIEQLIALEFDSHIPYPIDEVDYDFQVLGQSSKNKNLRDVLLVATRKENTKNLLSSFAFTDIRVEVIDVRSHVFERVLPFLLNKTKEDDEGLILIFDLGASHTCLYAFHNGSVVFVRAEEFGGRQLFETLAAQGQVLSEEEQDAWYKGNLPSNLSEQAISDFNVTFSIQLSRTMEYFFSVYHFTEVKSIFLVGAVAYFPGLVNALKEKLGHPVYIGDPFEGMTYSDAVDQHALLEHPAGWVRVCGLAIRET